MDLEGVLFTQDREAEDVYDCAKRTQRETLNQLIHAEPGWLSWATQCNFSTQESSWLELSLSINVSNHVI